MSALPPQRQASVVEIQRAAAIESLEPEWKALLLEGERPLPFLHPTWQRAWLDEFQDGRELLLFAGREGERLIGIAPLLRAGDGTLTFAGSHSVCDYMDFIVTPGQEEPFLRSVLEQLAALEWSQLDLRGLIDGSPTLEHMPALAREAGLICERELEAVAPALDLPDSFDAYLAGLHAKDRHELRRKIRRLSQFGQPEIKCYRDAAQIEQLLPALLRFMVESRADKAGFLTEQMASFFHRSVGAMAREDIARLYMLELDATPVAGILCFELAGRLYMYNSGYDPDQGALAVGLISKALCIRDAIEAGIRSMDFLRGHEHYKYDLGATDQQIFRLTLRRTS
jgi:CelD/BcsL family acetyltransferase involved in cellulose biosynthesis